MDKRGRHLKKSWYILFALIIILIIIFLGPRLTPTGLFVFEESTGEQTWDFSNSGDYSYDNTINLSANSVQLLPTITTTTTSTTTISQTNLSSATLYNPGDTPVDKTSKLTSINNNNVNINNDDFVLEINFSSTLNNNDLISFYLRGDSDNNGVISICDDNTGCDNGELGSLTLPDDVDTGWYNLTLSGISSARVDFYIRSDDKIKIDAVTSYKATAATATTATITYPDSSSVQTADFQPTNWNRWDTFSFTEILNGQTTQYQYSTDSGSSWNNVPDGGNLSAIDSTKIRFQITLNSNGSATPTVSILNLEYTARTICTEDWSCTIWSPETCPENQTQTRTCTDNNECDTTENKPSETQSCTYVPLLPPCVESWSASFGACQINNQKLKYYLDGNNCGTFNNMPSDNGTWVSCDYCTPNWSETNTSCLADDQILGIYLDSNDCYTLTNLSSDNNAPIGNNYICDFCTPSWNEINGTCNIDNTLNSYFTDTKGCFALTNSISDNNNNNNNISASQTYTCDYCSFHNCTASFGAISIINENNLFKVDDLTNTNSSLEINSSASWENATVSIIEYNWSDRNNALESVLPLKRYYEINSSLESTSINNVKLTFYYTDEEISSEGIEENTLKIYYYNETYYNETNGKWKEQESVVDAVNNSVSAIVPHLSYYGLFGAEKVAVSSSSSSGGGSSGGSGGIIKSTLAEVPIINSVTKESSTRVFAQKLVQNELVSNNLACNYVLEVSLPEKISLIDEKEFPAEITNKGNCDIEGMNLYLSPELDSVVNLSTVYLEDLKQGEKAQVLIIRKSQDEQKNWFSFLTSSAILSFTTPKTFTGAMVLEGFAKEESVFKQNLNFDVEIPVREKFSSQRIISQFGLYFIVFILGVLFVYLITQRLIRKYVLVKKRKKKEERKRNKKN